MRKTAAIKRLFNKRLFNKRHPDHPGIGGGLAYGCAQAKRGLK